MPATPDQTPMRPILRHYRALLAGAIILLLAMQSREGNRLGGAKAAAKAEPVLAQLWSSKMPIPVAITFSPDGRRLAAASSSGDVTCLNSTGGEVWNAQLGRVDGLALGPDGSAVACTFLSPLENTVLFVSPDGKVEWQNDVHGAIWCVGASSQPGQFVVGTGERYCYVYTVTEHRHKYRRWKVPGAPCSAVFSPDGRNVVVGTWQDAGVGVFGLSGEKIAWWTGEQDRLYTAEMTRAGNMVVTVAKPNTEHPPTTIQLKTLDLRDVWSNELRVPEVSVDVSETGESSAIGFLHTMAHKETVISEKHIAFYNRSGRVVWEKGGLFGQWNLLQICSSGNLLLYDESSSICLVSPNGDVLLKTKLPGTIRSFARSPQRDKIALYCNDGTLHMFSAR